jgi:hypothetical protein
MSLTDTMGSLAVATKGQYMVRFGFIQTIARFIFLKTGVSTDIGTSFCRPAGRTGDVLHIKAQLIGMVLFSLGSSSVHSILTRNKGQVAGIHACRIH